MHLEFLTKCCSQMLVPVMKFSIGAKMFQKACFFPLLTMVKSLPQINFEKFIS